MVKVAAKLIRHPKTHWTMPNQFRDWFKVADPFIVHGHRLSSLYRSSVITSKSFIVLKILKNLVMLAKMEFEYFRNNDGLGARI